MKNRERFIKNVKRTIKNYLDSNLIDIYLDEWTNDYCNETGKEDVTDKEWNDKKQDLEEILPEILKLLE